MEIVNKIISVLLEWYVWVPAALVLLFLIFNNTRKKESVGRQEAVLLSVEVPKLSEKGPLSAELMFSSLHGILKSKSELTKRGMFQEYISFEIESKPNSIRFYVWVPVSIKEFVEGQIYSQYPTAVIKEANDYTKEILTSENAAFAGAEIVLTKKDFFPIKTFQDFEVDPLAGITGVMSKVGANERIWLQILARPIDESWESEGATFIANLESGSKSASLRGQLAELPREFTKAFIESVLVPPSGDSGKGSTSKPAEKKMSEAEKIQVKMIAEKLQKLAFQVKIRVCYFGEDEQTAKAKLSTVIASFKQFNTTYLNGFVSGKVRTDDGYVNEYIARAFLNKGSILNTAELASLYHLPYASVETPTIVWTSSKKGEPPQDLPIEGTIPNSELSLFGQVDFRNTKTKFGIKRLDRPRHVYIVGKSGMGKSELLKLLMISDIYHGKGVALIDPHGDLAEEILNYIPKNRINDVVYINPADKDHPVSFNPLEFTDPDLKYHVASGFVSIFKKIFGFSWGPRLEHIFRYTTLALLEYPNSTTLGVVRMLTDKTFRKKVRKNITDPAVKNFWQTEFEAYSEKFANEAVAPILNKVGQFVATPVIRNIIGQPKSTVDFADVINNNKILLVNLSIGKLGEDNAALLGAMFVTKLHLAAMQRAHIAKEERTDYYLYVDEFQHFATDSFANILSEARKYKLCLTVANQYVAQMPEEVQNAVFGNIGTLISFRVGAADAKLLEREFQPVFLGDDLVYLGVQNIYVKMAIDGQTSAPFSANTIASPSPTENNAEAIIESSRKQYANDRQAVEDNISKWQGQLDEEASADRDSDLERKHAERGTGPRPSSNYGSRSYDRPRRDDRPPRRDDRSRREEERAPEVLKAVDDFSDFEAPSHSKKEAEKHQTQEDTKHDVAEPTPHEPNTKPLQPEPKHIDHDEKGNVLKPGDIIKFD